MNDTFANANAKILRKSGVGKPISAHFCQGAEKSIHVLLEGGHGWACLTRLRLGYSTLPRKVQNNNVPDKDSEKEERYGELYVWVKDKERKVCVKRWEGS